MGDVVHIADYLGKAAKDYKDPKIVTHGVQIKDPDRLPSGLFAFDLATGGGVPRGRCSVMYGDEDSMKTTLCLKLIAQAQRLFPKQKAVFIDVEHVFGPTWAKTMGVDVDNLIFVQPDNAEQMVDIVEGILQTDDVSIVVVDSLAALITQHEIDKSAEDAIVGRTGIVINKFYRRVSRALGKARREGRQPTLVVITQIRYKIGVMYGNPETMPGGPSFKFASSMTIRFHGKDVMDSAVSTTLPAYKEVSASIRKYKVPILAKKAIMQIALQPIEGYGLEVGQAYDWNTLRSYLKSMEFFVKRKKDWELTHPGTGEVILYSKQDDLKAAVFKDAAWGQELKSALIEAMMQTDEILE